jgi:hypothetical protein
MSLINEALKKAQRSRSDDPEALVPPMPGGATHVARAGQPRSSQPLLLLASGGLVLVVLSVVITFWLVNRPSAEMPGAKNVAPKLAANPTSPAPVIVPPVIKSPTVVAAGASPPPPPAVTAPRPTVPISAPPVVLSRPVVAEISPTLVTPTRAQPAPEAPAAPPPPPAAVVREANIVATSSLPAPTVVAEPSLPATAAPPKTDERVHQFVDAVKVTGIRSSGGDSRVLMNDRVFRVNDIVERNLGVRLTNVEPNALTFTDGNGATYVKHF